MSISELLQKVPRVIRSQWRHLEYNLSRKINLNWFDIARYQLLLGERPNLKNPKTWSEKLLWLNRNWQPDIKSECADKLKVRDYVRNKGLDFLLVPLLGVWSTPEEINFESLPNQFVLKCNHGSGCNIVCTDKSKLDFEQAKKNLAYWLTLDYGKLFNEKHYSKIKPIIFCEKFLPFLANNSSLIDYKLHCFNGIPQFFDILSNRDNEKHQVSFANYSLNWELLDYAKNSISENEIIPRPISLDKMIEYAVVLIESFPYARVDFYEIDGIPFFGEITFTPAANIDCDYKMEIQYLMGEKLILPKQN